MGWDGWEGRRERYIHVKMSTGSQPTPGMQFSDVRWRSLERVKSFGSVSRAGSEMTGLATADAVNARMARAVESCIFDAESGWKEMLLGGERAEVRAAVRMRMAWCEGVFLICLSGDVGPCLLH